MKFIQRCLIQLRTQGDWADDFKKPPKMTGTVLVGKRFLVERLLGVLTLARK